MVLRLCVSSEEVLLILIDPCNFISVVDFVTSTCVPLKKNTYVSTAVFSATPWPIRFLKL